jgi:hypothetical protein
MHDIRDMEKNAERAAAKPVNRYDNTDIVRRGFLMNAEGLKFASYRVRDVSALYEKNIESFSSLQHHLTYVPVSKFGDRMLVNEIGATIYAMLDDGQAAFLATVIPQVEAIEDFDHAVFTDEADSGAVIHAYRVVGAGHVEFQVRHGAQVLGVMPLNVARMFCTLAGRARDGVPSLATVEPEPEASAIAGEVDRALQAPMEEVSAQALDDAAAHYSPIGTPEVDGKKLGDALRSLP